MTERVTIFPCGMCGRTVGCPCLSSGDYIRAMAAVERRHKQAVARAKRPPVDVTIAEAMDAADNPPRAVRPQQRARASQPSLDEFANAAAGRALDRRKRAAA